MENCSKGLKYALSGRMEIHPCVQQDIGPLRPLPYSHSTSSAITPSRASGTADHVRSLDDLFIIVHVHLYTTSVAMYPAFFGLKAVFEPMKIFLSLTKGLLEGSKPRHILFFAALSFRLMLWEILIFFIWLHALQVDSLINNG